MSGPPPSDIRSLPTSTLNLYLYGIGAWGAVLLILLGVGRIELALPLTYAVALWQGGLTLWWGPRMLAKFHRGELSRGEADAGVQSVGRLLGASAMLLAYFGSSLVTRLSNPWTHAGILILAGLALPINATGAVTFAAAFGLFDKLVH